ncbi:MAG: DMT family transporter [Candidatus Rokubacteria bacterium]|nr:DMT family transporter [Candidatus Rokubacteria bacterium]
MTTRSSCEPGDNRRPDPTGRPRPAHPARRLLHRPRRGPVRHHEHGREAPAPASPDGGADLGSFLLLASTSLFFAALGFVPLADATAVSFTSPLLVAALAGPMLAERVSRGHWLAIAVGFCGALIVIRPGAEGANPYLLLVVASSGCYAVYQILTRRMAAYDRPEVSVTYSAIVGTLVLSVAVPFFWRTPDRLSHWLILSAVGLLGGLGHYFVARAFLWGEASILSPFQYAQLIGAAGMGYLAFGDVPSGWTWGGATVITASGLYIAWQESQRSRGVRAASRT